MFFNVLWYENIFNFIYLVKKYLHFNFFLSFLMLFVTAVDFPLFLLLENESVPSFDFCMQLRVEMLAKYITEYTRIYVCCMFYGKYFIRFFSESEITV